MIKNALFTAQIMHKRLIPKVNQFLYKAYYICFDIDEIEQLKSKIFSINRFNLFSFYNKDHGLRNQESPKIWLQKILQDENIEIKGAKFYLSTMPRILGYVFNPVSFWFCVDENNNLKAVLAEVNNTFGESHNYLIFEKNGDPINPNKFYEANKEFHVSPFLKVEGKYKFRFVFEDKKIGAWIDFFNDENQLMLMTSLVGKRSELSVTSLLKSFFVIPLITLKVIFLIHFQALKLVLKKIKYIKRPLKPTNQITKIK